MNKLIISMLLILSVSCNSNNQQPLDTIASIQTNEPKYLGAENDNMYTLFTTDSYELKFELNTLENATYDLVVHMELKKGSYYVSPNSKGDFKGIFSISLEDNDKVYEIAKLIETPASVEEYDPHPFVNGFVNWVKENTSYKQQLERISDENFVVTGVVQFTIEPNCTLEKISFFIKYHDGEMKVEIDRC